LDSEQLACGEQENQHDKEEYCETSDNARGDPPVHKRHVPGADAERETLIVVEGDLIGGLGLG